MRTQSIQEFHPRTVEQRQELGELRTLQKNMNKDFSFSEKNTKIAAKPQDPDPPRLQQVPALFLLASVFNRLDQLENYLAGYCGSAMERRQLLNSEDEYGRSALFYAVMKGDHHLQAIGSLPAVEYLLEKGADIRKKDYKERTMYARGDM